MRDCDVCPELVVVPAGRFVMGSRPSVESRSRDEVPQRLVRFMQPFALGKYEVSFAQWDACVADGGCGAYRPDDRDAGRGRHPVIGVNWGDAKRYLRWLSRKTGRIYRLPSELEWEYAARAGTETRFYWGDSVGRANANCAGCNDGYPRAAPVGSFDANGFGLHDMLGNVWEWVDDCAKSGRDCSRRVLRGGSWGNDPGILTSTYSLAVSDESRSGAIGFRVAATHYR
jgi:formylglycine-generating enzyme required for sulfatase activity